MMPTQSQSQIDASGQSSDSVSEQPAPIPEHPDNLALFLDIDGTLLEIVERPELVRVPSELLQCLETLALRLEGALALVTGRTLENTDLLFPGMSLPVGAVHGMERRSFHGTVESAGAEVDIAPLRDALAAFVADRPGLLLEDKGRTLALHYRAAPELEAEVHAFILEHLFGQAGLALLHGKMVFEIKPEGADKGAAIRAFMAEEPFAGRVPVFLGDDTTDEYGFAAAHALGGYGYCVGLERESKARYRLADVAAVHDWLGRLTESLER